MRRGGAPPTRLEALALVLHDGVVGLEDDVQVVLRQPVCLVQHEEPTGGQGGRPPPDQSSPLNRDQLFCCSLEVGRIEFISVHSKV